jgi:hypothetical protein
MKWLAVVIAIGGIGEASAAISSHPGGSSRHLAVRPMGMEITPDSFVRVVWQHWLGRGATDMGDHKLWLRRGKSVD